MHRRARHIALSARSAGALVMLDSRTITGLSGGANVSSWASLGTQSITMAGVATKNPTYQVSIQGGQPVVRFVATASTAMSSAFTDTLTQYTHVCTFIPRLIENFKHLVSTDDGSYNTIKFSVSHVTTNLSGTGVKPPTTDFYPFSTPVDVAYINSIGYTGTGLIAYRPNTTATVTVTGTTTRLCLGSRLTGSDFATSDLMQFMIFPSVISKSLRRRFEVAASYAFKISDINNTAVS